MFAHSLTTPASAATPRPPLLHALAAVLLAAAMIAAGGCGGVNTAELNDQGIATTAQPSSSASMDVEGRQLANYQGTPPTMLKQDAEGSWLTTPGIGSVITFDPDTSQIYVWSPGDTTMEGVTVTPEPDAGEPSFSADLITANRSTHAGVQAEQYEHAMQAIEGMTATEAEARVEQMAEAGEISRDVADVLLQAVMPRLP